MSLSAPSPPPLRKNIKQACDGCKIRKIKCSESPPCEGCRAAGIPCTRKSKPGLRGPRSLRPATLREIRRRQERESEGIEGIGKEETVEEKGFGEDREGSGERASSMVEKTPVENLILRLHDYHQRLFPVWPIVDSNALIATLESTEVDLEAYALANAIGAATIAQLKQDRAGEDICMEAECQRVRNSATSGLSASLNSLRIPFFLHVYHENLQPGGIKSLLYLREAITLAQIMGLHRESTYTSYPPAEQQIRRRILWLLFVTERGVAMLHKLPAVLKPSTFFPSTDDDSMEDESPILPAFGKLTSLFWIFDQSGAFDILQNEPTSFNGSAEVANRRLLENLQKKLQDIPVEREPSNDIQRADICVTRSWMRAVLWRASMARGRFSAGDMVSPVTIAREFLGVISGVPRGAIEAHGPSMELKIFEIANAVMDAISNSQHTSWMTTDSPRDVVNHLQQILVSCRGGNKPLVAMLCNRIAEVHGHPQLLIEPSSRVVEINEQWSNPGYSTADFDSSLAGTSPMSAYSGHQLVRGSQALEGDVNTGSSTPSTTSYASLLQQPFTSSGSLAWEAELLSGLHGMMPTTMLRDDGFG